MNIRFVHHHMTELPCGKLLLSLREVGRHPATFLGLEALTAVTLQASWKFSLGILHAVGAGKMAKWFRELDILSSGLKFIFQNLNKKS